MMEKKTSLVYEQYMNYRAGLQAAHVALLQQARDITKQAYAPYFLNFRLGLLHY